VKRPRQHTTLRVKRSPHLVAHWRANQLVIRNYALGAASLVNPLACAVLDLCSEWQTLDALKEALSPAVSAVLPKLVKRLIDRSLLIRSDRPRDPRERAMSTLDRWNPEAGFFHTATKNVRFWSPQEAARQARKRNQTQARPAVQKRYPGVPRLDLPPPGDGEFARIALARRTWRRFSTTPVTLQDLSTILGLSAGIQKWVRGPGRETPLKTSPSGGARHPIEVYVVARDVIGLRPGLYHYAADRHALERLRGGTPERRIRAYLPRSRYFARASALVLMTAVFERQLWRYPYSRAYRAALIEVGHMCQTFCLAATSLGLAPFSVMGLADSTIERDLGIDGITESVLYAAGVGCPPAGTDWAPLPRGRLSVRDNPRFRRR
jgi:SagB-type dehydrogenase family enzyme